MDNDITRGYSTRENSTIIWAGLYDGRQTDMGEMGGYRKKWVGVLDGLEWLHYV